MFQDKFMGIKTFTKVCRFIFILFLHLVPKDESECVSSEACDVDGFPMCIDNKCVGK